MHSSIRLVAELARTSGVEVAARAYRMTTAEVEALVRYVER